MSVVHASATSRVVRDGAAFREDEVATEKRMTRMIMLPIVPIAHHTVELLRRCGCFMRRSERFCCFGTLLDRLIMSPSFIHLVSLAAHAAFTSSWVSVERRSLIKHICRRICHWS